MSAFFKNLKFAWVYFVRGRHRDGPAAQWVAPPLLEGQLWFGSLLVADLHQMHPHQGTWFADYHLRIAGGQGELQDRLLAYIAFSEDVNRAIDEGRDHDFDEFDRFDSISACGSWSARLANRSLVPMEGKLWFADGDASWHHSETDPFREAAANEFWIQNAHGS